jgi:Flp pilus assembly pilin Flp
MMRTQSDATVVLAMKRLDKEKGQALIEYAFLLVLLATITFAVIILAGNQLLGLYQDVSFEFSHLLDSNTYTSNGTVVAPGASPSAGTCAVGQTPVLRGHHWKCK